MFNHSTLARRARIASALGLVSLLSAGIWAPAFAAPDPNPPIRSQADRNRRPNARRGDVLRGTVARVYNAHSFDLRADDGRTYRVNMRFALGLQAQSEVRVVGDLNGSTLEARLVTVGDFGNDRNDDGYNDGGYDNNDNGDDNPPPASDYQGQQVTLTGRITRITSRTDFEVRDDDDGTIYRVRTDDALPYSVRQGDRIEARGELNGNTVTANSAVGIGDNYNNNGGQTDDVPTGGGQTDGATYVNFSGPILSIDSNREEARVRAGNGYTYTLSVRRSTLDNFRVGQRVRVQGNWINERVEVTSLARE